MEYEIWKYGLNYNGNSPPMSYVSFKTNDFDSQSVVLKVPDLAIQDCKKRREIDQNLKKFVGI